MSKRSHFQKKKPESPSPSKKKPSGPAYIRPDAAVVPDPLSDTEDVVSREDVLNRSRVEYPSITGDGYPY